MNKKILQAIKITLFSLAIMGLMFSLIVSQDFHHLETCEVEHCPACSMIQFAQAIIMITFLVFIYKLVSFTIYFFLSRLHKNNDIFMQKSLVFQKVQLNN